MVKKIVVLALAVFMCATMASALEIGGVNMPDTIKAADSDLALNGAGIREKFFMKLYVGGLYLSQKNQDAAAIIAADAPMAIRLNIISSLITSEKMENATMEGFENSTGNNIEPLQNEIESFINIFREQINEGDIFDFVYVPGKGVEVFKNTQAASVIEGLEFKKALFGIWLCDKPAQKSLKQEMLGL